MAKPSRSFVCQSCGTASTRWAGRCNGCGEWNTLTEEAVSPGVAQGGIVHKLRPGRVVALESLSGTSEEAPRFTSGIGELDRLMGGGFVPGSAVLVAGDPGIGKSTLLLQVAALLAHQGRRVVYFSGEEAPAQIRLRAKRLGLQDAPTAIAAETNLSDILATLADGDGGDGKVPDLVIIDSIQTLWSDTVESAPGTVSQVRASAQGLIRFAKRTNTAIVIVGHVTKDGQIAGPKVVEHMVDTVLYFEGDTGRHYRILRAVKNRFGPVAEIGVFEMGERGLREVSNPSELFLGDREDSSPGSAVFAGIEGTRPILVDVQALVAPSPLGTPRRAVVGWDSNRLSMILAVLDARCGVQLGGHDVYLNVAGGLRLSEPAADLAAAAALLSSLTGVALPADCVYFGEISLSGAVRSVGHMSARLKEAHKLGFKSAITPASGEIETDGTSISVERLTHLKDLAHKLTKSSPLPD